MSNRNRAKAQYQYDFDKKVERKGTDSIKYDFAAEYGMPEDVLPLWIADMDFPAPQPVLDILQGAVQHGIFGYTGTKEDYYQAAANWFWQRYSWQTQPEWLVSVPGVVFAIAIAIRTLTKPGDCVLIQPPVYGPFFQVVQRNDRVLVENPLSYKNGRYEINFTDFEQKIIENQVKLFILCSPHNPTGRVWTREELFRLGRICKKHGVFVISDEIHCDFAFPEHPHTVFFSANTDLAEQTIICTAPTKTFNLAGLQTANIWIPGSGIREAFCREAERLCHTRPNRLGLLACKAAYTTGGEWLEQCQVYLRENLTFLRDFLQTQLPQIRLVEPEGTYFAWLDFSELHLEQQEVENLVIHRAHLWLDSGLEFGSQGRQFQRVVLACTRATLQEALIRLKEAVDSLPR